MYLKRGYWIAYNVDPDQMPCFVAFDTIDTFAQTCTPDYLEQIRIQGVNIHFQEGQLCKNGLTSLLKKDLLWKERICSLWEQILSFKSRPIFRRDLVCKKAKKEVTEVVSLDKNGGSSTRCP